MIHFSQPGNILEGIDNDTIIDNGDDGKCALCRKKEVNNIDACLYGPMMGPPPKAIFCTKMTFCRECYSYMVTLILKHQEKRFGNKPNIITEEEKEDRFVFGGKVNAS